MPWVTNIAHSNSIYAKIQIKQKNLILTTGLSRELRQIYLEFLDYRV